MMVRKAHISDAEFVAECLLLAMENIVYAFIGICDRDKALEFMQYFAGRPNNQYSYENCWVAIEKGRIVAVVNIYNGADLQKLRTPVLDYIEKQYNRKLVPEDETQAGEYYIDTLGVFPEYQGKGVGTILLNFLKNEYAEKRSEMLGLLVDENNPLAKKLYLKLGFKLVDKKTLMGKKMEHLQFDMGGNFFK
jgi:ribosomal protein S18 acetylase RimI-like enzyme